MSHIDTSNIEDQPVFSAFNCFVQKLKDGEWISHSSKDEMKSCIHSAKNIEGMLETLANNGSLDNFIALVPNLYGLDVHQLQKACDIVLAMVLTAPGVALPCVRICIEEYFHLCGSDRFENVLSSALYCSEIYRVLLDYAASIESNLEQIAIELQSQLFIRLWKAESNTEKLKNDFYDWLKTDPSGQNIGTALQVIIMSEDTNISSSLVFALMKALQERGDTAVMFWSILDKLPLLKKAFEKSDELLKGALEFLKTSAQWMEATATLTWVSREKGPCKSLGFEKLVSAVKCLLETEGITSVKTKQFMVKRKNSAGCTFWDDVEMRLIE